MHHHAAEVDMNDTLTTGAVAVLLVSVISLFALLLRADGRERHA